MNLQQLLDAVANAPETEIDLSEVDVEEVTASVAVYGNELKAEPPSPERVAKIKNLVAAHAKLEGEKTRRAAIAEEQAAAETSLSALLAPPEEEKPEEPATAAPETAPTLPVAQSVTASLASIGKPASETKEPKFLPIVAGATVSATSTDMVGGREIGYPEIGRLLEGVIANRAPGYDHVVFDDLPDGSRMVAPGSGAIVASVDVFGGDRNNVLSAGSTAANTLALWAGSQEPDARVRLAAAGFDCGPNDRDFSLPNGWRQDTPFHDLFQKRPLNTMSYGFYRTSTLATLFPGTSVTNPGSVIWTNANQTAVDPLSAATWKPENVVDCTQTEITESAWAVVAIARWNSFTALSLLPILENFQQALNTNRARVTEAKLMQKFAADCFQRTAIAPFGGLAGFLEVAEAAVADQYWNERLKPEVFTLAMPEPFRAVLRTDLRNRGFQQDDTDLNSVIDRRIQEAGFPAPVWYIDDYLGRTTPLFPAVGSSLSPASVKQIGRQNGQTTTWTIFFVPKAHYHIGERPIMNQRALTPGFADARQNAAASMFETAMSLGRHGTVRGIQLELQLRASGARAANQTYEPTTAVDYSTDITTPLT
jgi:hypothetical protein